MQYALIRNDTVATFPYSETQFRRDNPRTSFPKKMKLPVDAQNGTLVAVVEADRPTVTDAQVLIPDATPTLVDGTWVLGWTVRDKTAEEIAEAVDQARADAKRRMLAWVNEFLAPFTKKAADAEPLAWSEKADAAKAYLASTATTEQTLLIETEAGVTGETPTDLCNAILAQAGLYRVIIAFTTGLRRKTSAEIDAAQPADIPAILDAAKQAAMAKAAELGIA